MRVTILAIAASIFFFGLFVQPSIEYSLSIENFSSLVKLRCFNRSSATGEELILGQNEPIGMSIENLISAIERLERLNPSYQPATIIRILLERFHSDGVRYDGEENYPSSIEYHHALLTNAILGNNDPLPVARFTEHHFTEDEKCNLFFTISHFINDTASSGDSEMDTYFGPPVDARAHPMDGLKQKFGVMHSTRNIGEEVVIGPTKPLPDIEIESFKDDNQKIPSKRDSKSKTLRKTRHPREYGVASFRSAKSNSIGVARVLLGMFVGFTNPGSKLMSKIIHDLKKQVPKDMEDKTLDPLMAVTLSDLYGIDTQTGMGDISGNKIFGADGKWNNTVCHTEYILEDNEGIAGTLAEFRGGIDGYSIGSMMLSKTFFLTYPNITASQVLRYYYSKQGLLGNVGICHRNQQYDGQMIEDLKEEAIKYLIIWNSHIYENMYPQSKLAGYVESLKAQVSDVLKRSAVKNPEEASFCTEPIATAIKDEPCEGSVDAFFMLDLAQSCQRNRNDARCKQAIFVSEMVKRMNMKQNGGSVSVIYNAEGSENPNIFDDQFRPVKTPLYPVVFNSTSGECAACKALYANTIGRNIIDDRNEMLKLIKELLDQHGQKNANETGIPGKAFFWIDYGTIKSIPTDKIKYLNYQTALRKLLYQERDTTFFGMATNASTLSDIIPDSNRIVSIIPNNNIIENNEFDKMAEKLCQVPSVLQYADCKNQPSNNVVYSGLITPNYKQYWVMNPEYFLKSFQIQMNFMADSQELEVCFARTPFPEADSKNCRSNTPLVISNPCEGHTLENCQPLYFTISLKNPGKTTPFCTDINCKNSRQVRWNVTHTGVSCNKSAAIQISVFLMMITMMISCFIRTNFFY